MPSDYSLIFQRGLFQMGSSADIVLNDVRFDNLTPLLEQNVTNRFLNSSSFLNLNQTLTERLEQIQIRKSQLELNLEEIQKQQNEIASRLNQIESPIGKLPIGLGESISFFPIALSIIFLIYSFILSDMIMLRGELHQWHKKLRLNVSIIAPLWIDPITLKDRKSMFQLHRELAKLIVYIIPIIIFGVTLYIILDIRESINYTYNNGMSLYNKESLLQIFNILYMIAIGMIGYAFLVLIIAIHNYNKLLSGN